MAEGGNGTAIRATPAPAALLAVTASCGGGGGHQPYAWEVTPRAGR